MVSFSLSFFKFLDALSDAEILLCSVALNDKEAASFVEIRMSSHLKVIKITHLLFTALVERNYFLDEFLFIALQSLSVSL